MKVDLRMASTHIGDANNDCNQVLIPQVFPKLEKPNVAFVVFDMTTLFKMVQVSLK
jgi:hypothetical protein